jgi:hypothetical protein
MYRKKVALSLIVIISTLFGLTAFPLLSQADSNLPPRPPVPPIEDGDDQPQAEQQRHEIVGAYIELHGDVLPPEVWTVVQWQDAAGNWHDVEGWRGTTDQVNYRRWWVHPKDFGTGPFRWVMTDGLNGASLATSDSFNLPAAPNNTTFVALTQ